MYLAIIQQVSRNSDHLTWPDAFAIGGVLGIACLLVGFITGWRPFQKGK